MTAKTVLIAACFGLLCIAAWWLLHGEAGGASRAAGARTPPAERAALVRDGAPALATQPNKPAVKTPTIDGASEDGPTSPGHWLRQIKAAKDKATLNAVLTSLAALNPDEALRLLRQIYARIPNLKRRLVILRFFGAATRGRTPHPRAVAILDLGVHDPLLRIQSTAFDLLAGLTRLDFSENMEGYERWLHAHGEKSAEVVIREGAVALVQRLRVVEGVALEQALRREGLLSRWDARYLSELGAEQRRSLIEAGATDLAHRWWADDRNSATVRAAGLQWIDVLDPEPAYLHEHVVPILGEPMHHSDEVIRGAIRLLGTHGKPWAFDVLVAAFEKVPGKSQWGDLARVLAGFGDARAIPAMIGVIDADNGYESVYMVGHFGLTRLTGVRYEEKHDGAWWRSWWTANRARFANARAMDVPQLNPNAR